MDGEAAEAAAAAQVDLLDDSDLMHVQGNSQGVADKERDHNHHEDDWQIVITTPPAASVSKHKVLSIESQNDGKVRNRTFPIITNLKTA